VGAPAAQTSQSPERPGLVLTALIVVAGVANLNLSVANVAPPDIGKHFDSSQTTLDLVAVGYSLGLACSVPWLGGYPASVQDEIIAGAKSAFLHGDQWAYTAGIVAILLGAVIVFLCFPKKQEEQELLARYGAEDERQPTRA
jgi:MFS family permease